MRVEADQAEVSYNVEGSGLPIGLSNPLLETERTVVQESCAPRFDFYTDPMSAFSDSKRSGKAGNQIRPDCFTSPSNSCFPMSRFSPSLRGPRNPSPAYQFQSSWSPNQIMYQTQGFGHSSGPHRSPIGMPTPFSMHPHPPEAWNGTTGPTTYNVSSNPSRGGHLTSAGFGPRGSPYSNTGQGRGEWISQSPSPCPVRGGTPSPSSGRGGNRWYGGNMSPSFGQSSGRGRGSHAHLSAQDRPLGREKFYNASMLEDPWKFLKPVSWRGGYAPLNNVNTPDSSKSWTTKSHSTKKPRVVEASNNSTSQPSLAEYLAASFNEAVNDAATST